MFEFVACLLLIAQGEAASGAPAKAAGDAPAGPPGWMQLVLMFGPIAILFYFMLLRPQQKQERERRDLIAKLRKNDRVLTIGGIKGVVVNVKTDEDEVVLRVDDSTGTKIPFARSAIAKVLSSESSADAKETKS